MIKYDTGRLGLQFIFSCHGSVFPKALIVSVPNAVLGVMLFMYLRDVDGRRVIRIDGVETLWTAYTSVLGFLIVFRNNQAYSRFWEGATLIHQVRGEWFNAVSSLFAFTSQDEGCQDDVKAFQLTLIRLASLAYCSALQQVCSLSDDSFEIIEAKGMEIQSLDFLRTSSDRCEVIVQWIQRLIIDGLETDVIKIPSPLLTRAYQELSRGVVKLNEARKIKEIPFPFPYAQMIQCMLIVHWVLTPVVASQLVESASAIAVMCFCLICVPWCLVFITMEIDQPFGEDANDLPVKEMQRDFNSSLLTLMHPLAQRVPSYNEDDTVSHLRSSDIGCRSVALALERMARGHDVVKASADACTTITRNLSEQHNERKKSRGRTWFLGSMPMNWLARSFSFSRMSFYGRQPSFDRSASRISTVSAQAFASHQGKSGSATSSEEVGPSDSPPDQEPVDTPAEPRPHINKEERKSRHSVRWSMSDETDDNHHSGSQRGAQHSEPDLALCDDWLIDDQLHPGTQRGSTQHSQPDLRSGSQRGSTQHSQPDLRSSSQRGTQHSQPDLRSGSQRGTLHSQLDHRSGSQRSTLRSQPDFDRCEDWLIDDLRRAVSLRGTQQSQPDLDPCDEEGMMDHQRGIRRSEPCSRRHLNI